MQSINKTFLFQEKLVQPFLGKNSKTTLFPLNIDEDFIDDGEGYANLSHRHDKTKILLKLASNTRQYKEKKGGGGGKSVLRVPVRYPHRHQ
jgi:hypothetical protein